MAMTMSYERYRTRNSLYSYKGDLVVRRNIDDSIYFEQSSSGSIMNYEAISDSKHPGWNSIHKEGDVGGDMFLIREKMINKASPCHTVVNDGNPLGLTSTWDGNLFPVHPLMMTFPNPENYSDEVLNELGASVVEETAPGNSAFDAWTALGELYRDGIPQPISNTVRDRAFTAKTAGDNYLNIQFGWKPLVNDVLGAVDMITRAADILKQLERDSGRIVRRRRTVLDKIEDPEYTTLGYGPPFVGETSYGPAGFGTWQQEKTIHRKIWFSAAFTYYIPGNTHSSNAIIRGAAKANALLGIEITPKKLWNLAPWSWLADWFSNAGDVISNVERFSSGNLVMHYGYLMEHVVVDHTYTWTPGLGGGTSQGATPGPFTLRTETKRRVQANPFGFGITWPSLSDFQLSILASLGITRKK